MTREGKEDFAQLDAFIAGYNLKVVLAQGPFRTALSLQHKRYLALLIAAAELDHQQSGKKRPPAVALPTAIQMDYFGEAVSDVGQALFSWIHGAYKPARVMLRSSIETFVKGAACGEKPEVLTTKSVYEVFDLAEKATFFSSEPGSTLLKELEQEYAELSKDVHTAFQTNMSKISALNYFPAFEGKKAGKVAEVFDKVAARELTILALVFNKAFHRMHHRNRETILVSVLSRHKRRIQNIE